jgi:hypothetical protein
VVTNISYDLNAGSMELLFTPMRGISDEEYELVTAAQADPETKKYIQLTVAQADGATKAPALSAPATKANTVSRSDEPDDDEVEAPVKRATKTTEPAVEKKQNLASVIDQWGSDDEED